MAHMDDKQRSWSSYSTDLIKYVKLQIRYQNAKGLIVGPPPTPMHCEALYLLWEFNLERCGLFHDFWYRQSAVGESAQVKLKRDH